MNNLENKRVLILAGSTWVRIDKVRVITNIFTGELGLLIAREFFKYGAKVTLLMGSGRRDLVDPIRDNFHIIYFNYFEELLLIIKKIIKKYEIIINSAAISDYKPSRLFSGKIKSGKKELIIKLQPTIKIIDLIRRLNPSAILIKFKLESGKSKEKLINKAFSSLIFSRANFIVANDMNNMAKNHHKTFIIDKNKKITCSETKKQTAKNLVKLINNFCN